MRVLDFFRKKEKENIKKKSNGVLAEAYKYSGKAGYMSFNDFSNLPEASDYEFVYTAIIAMLASNDPQFEIACRGTDIFNDGQVDMEAAMSEFMSWYKDMKKNGINLSLDEFKEFMLYDSNEKFNYSINMNRANIKQDLKQFTEGNVASIIARSEALGDRFVTIEEEYEIVRRGR
jgi:hypothetical protein